MSFDLRSGRQWHHRHLLHHVERHRHRQWRCGRRAGVPRRDQPPEQLGRRPEPCRHRRRRYPRHHRAADWDRLERPRHRRRRSARRAGVRSRVLGPRLRRRRGQPVGPHRRYRREHAVLRRREHLIRCGPGYEALLEVAYLRLLHWRIMGSQHHVGRLHSDVIRLVHHTGSSRLQLLAGERIAWMDHTVRRRRYLRSG